MNKRGFTLIETLVYIAILGMVVSSIVAYSLSLSGARNKNYVAQNVQANSRTMLSIMGEKIRASSVVVTPSAGATSNQLVLDMPGVLPNIIFSVFNSQLIMTEVGSPDVALTDSRVVVTGLVFTNAATSGERDIINIQATVSYNVAAGDVEHRYTQDLRTAVIRRN